MSRGEYPCSKCGQPTLHDEAERYFLSQDNSAHHYIVPVSRMDEWNEWRDIPEDDPRAWDAPEWAQRIEGGLLTFENPTVE